MELILASQSPRRRELLGLFHLPFRVQVADIDESMDPTLPPEQEVARVSRAKAEAVARGPEDVVIAADTIVVLDGKVLGKPESTRHAEEMLCALSGSTHKIMTGMTVLRGDQVITHTEITDVWFRTISEKEILRYIATGEPMDKAGAYGIQGGAARFVEKIHGDFFNAMGLPLCRLEKMIRQLAPEVMEELG